MVNKVKIIQKLAIVVRGKILVLKRSASDPSRPGTWDFPGGNVDDADLIKYPRQTLLSVVIREVLEEVGIEINNNLIKLVVIDSAKSMDGDNLVIWIGYQVNVVGQPNIRLSREHSEYKWVTKGEFETLDFGFAKKNFVDMLDNIW